MDGLDEETIDRVVTRNAAELYRFRREILGARPEGSAGMQVPHAFSEAVNTWQDYETRLREATPSVS